MMPDQEYKCVEKIADDPHHLALFFLAVERMVCKSRIYWYLTVLNSEIVSREVFLVCHRSFANVVKLIVRDSTGHDNSRASKTWHGVHILDGSPKICHLPYVRYKIIIYKPLFFWTDPNMLQ